jgi:Arc/MetJ family transcription regulator
VATNLDIDQSLLEQARSLAGLSTKRETVNEALKEFIAASVTAATGSIKGDEYYEDYDYKALRRRRS